MADESMDIGKPVVRPAPAKAVAKPSQANPNGGIVEKEAPIDISNVMLVVKGKTTRVGFKVEDGKKVRFAKSTGEVID